MSTPQWWVTLLLTAAAYRFWRAISYDTITQRPRTWVLAQLSKRSEWDAEIFLLCPWCAGFWITGVALGLYCLNSGWIGLLSFLTHWFAMSLGVGLLGSKVDTE